MSEITATKKATKKTATGKMGNGKLGNRKTRQRKMGRCEKRATQSNCSEETATVF